MFDKYLIVDGSLRNVGPADAPSGFASRRSSAIIAALACRWWRRWT